MLGQISEQRGLLKRSGFIFMSIGGSIQISVKAEDSPIRYAAAQFLIGIWEFHVNDLDADFVSEMQEYVPTLFEQAWKFPQLRTIPVSQSITAPMTVLPYEKTEELVSSQEKFLVAPCICRREHRLMENGCEKSD